MRKTTVLVLGLVAAASAAGAVAVTLERQATTQITKGERLFPGFAGRLTRGAAAAADS